MVLQISQIGEAQRHGVGVLPPCIWCRRVASLHLVRAKLEPRASPLLQQKLAAMAVVPTSHSNQCLFHKSYFLAPLNVLYNSSASAPSKLSLPSFRLCMSQRIESSHSAVSNTNTLYHYSSLLQSCIGSQSFDVGKSVHAQMVAEGLVPDTFLQNKILMLYARSGEQPDMLIAQKLFDEMSKRNSTSWNTMILAFAQTGDHFEVLQLFTRMQKDGITLDKFTFPSVLKACIALKDEEAIAQLHSLIIKHGLCQNVVVGSTLVDGYATFGSLDHAQIVFDEIEGVNVITWNAIISGHVRSLEWEEAWIAFHDLQATGLSPNHSTFSMAAQACGALRSLTRGKQVHAKVIISGYEDDAFVGNSLIDMYAGCGDLEGCELVFKMMKKTSQVSWNSMISSYVHLGYFREALHMLLRMQQAGYQFDRFNLGSGLKASAALADAETGQTIHAYLLRRVLDTDVVLGSAITDMYAKSGCMREAHQVFNGMKDRNMVSWNSLLSGYVLEEDAEVATDIYRQMKTASIKPDQFTLASLLTLAANQRYADLGKVIHSHIVRNISRPSLVLKSQLVHMYARCGKLKDAWNEFSRMPDRNVYSWNSFMEGCLENNCTTEALQLFYEMQLSGHVPDCFSVSIVLSAISRLSTLDEGKQVHGFMVRRLLLDHNVLRCILVDMYAKCGFIDYSYRIYDRANEKDLALHNTIISACISHQRISMARRIFDEMEERNIISWNLMLIGYAKYGLKNEILDIFQQLICEGRDYDCPTLVPVFDLCASLAAAKFGKQLHVCAIKKGLTNSSVVLDTAVVNMYAKCGLIEEGRKFFNRMKERNVVTWNAMISGYSNHGESEGVFFLYEQMKREGICPNGITFLSILSVCSHTGLVEEGKNAFLSMLGNDIEAQVEHYNCMVDLLGRAGLLNDAKEMILRMPVEPDISTWVTLLGASRVHVDVDIGRFAAEKLFQLDPGNYGHYRLMADTYAAAGRWKEAKQMWKLMRERGAISEPGVSWIELDNEIQVFHAGDERHWRSQESYAALKSLSLHGGLYHT